MTLVLLSFLCQAGVLLRHEVQEFVVLVTGDNKDRGHSGPFLAQAADEFNPSFALLPGAFLRPLARRDFQCRDDQVDWRRLLRLVFRRGLVLSPVDRQVKAFTQAHLLQDVADHMDHFKIWMDDKHMLGHGGPPVTLPEAL